jgi:mannosyltransferase
MKNYQKYYPLLIVSFLIIIGTFLRLYHLDFNSFWLDEAATHVFTQQSIGEYWQLLSSLGEVHPPLFYLVEKIILPFGTSEFLYRLFPAIFGILTIPLFYIIGKKMFGSPVGIIMAALITFSPFHIQYSQDARMYTMLLFITAIALIFYLEAIKSNNLKYWLLFGLASALAIWTHFMAFIIIGTLIIYYIFYLVKEKKSPKNLIFSIVVIGVLLSPLIFIIKGVFFNRIGSAPTWGYTGDLFIVKSIIVLFSNNPISFFFFAILFCLGTVWLFFELREKFYFIFTIVTISLVTGFFLSYKMPIDPRYFIFLLPFLYAIIASSSLPFLQKASEKTVIAIFIVLCICVWSTQLYGYYCTPINEDWRAASAFIKNTARTNDIIILMPDYNQVPFNFYYNNSTYGTIQINTDSKDDLEKITSLRCKNKVSAYILVTGDLRSVDRTGEAISWIGSSRITEITNFNGVHVGKITSGC